MMMKSKQHAQQSAIDMAAFYCKVHLQLYIRTLITMLNMARRLLFFTSTHVNNESGFPSDVTLVHRRRGVDPEWVPISRLLNLKMHQLEPVLLIVGDPLEFLLKFSQYFFRHVIAIIFGAPVPHA